MRKESVSNLQEAFAYIACCQLATVTDLAPKKHPPKGELRRQISIAQTMVDWMEKFGVSVKETRAEEILGKCSVEEWASKFKP